MNKKLLLFILFFIILYLGNVNAEQKVVKSHINLTIIGYEIIDSNSTNSTKFNLTLHTEDEDIKINEIGKNTNIQNQDYLITLIREFNCQETDIANLTLECLRRVATVDGTALIECRESKARQFDTIQSCQSDNSKFRGIDGNLSVCNSNFAQAQGSLGNCSVTIGNLRTELDDNKGKFGLWVFISILGSGIVTYLYFKRKYGGSKSPLEKDFGRTTTAEPDIPERFKNRMEGSLDNKKI